MERAMGIEPTAGRLETTEYTSLLRPILEHFGTQSKRLFRLHPFLHHLERGRTHPASPLDRRAATVPALPSASRHCPRANWCAYAGTREVHNVESSKRPAPATARIPQPCWMTAACCSASQIGTRTGLVAIFPGTLAEQWPKVPAEAPEPGCSCSSMF